MSSKRSAEFDSLSRKKIRLSPNKTLRNTKQASSKSVSRNQPSLLECYKRADKELTVIRANRLRNEKNAIEDLHEAQFNMESYPAAKLVLILSNVPSKKRLTWMVCMIDESLPKKPIHWKKLSGVYFKFKLERKTIHARMLRVGDMSSLISYFDTFTSKYQGIISKYVEMSECIAITNKTIQVDGGAEAEFTYNMISCFECDIWKKGASTSSGTQITIDHYYDDSGAIDDVTIIDETLKSGTQSKITPRKCAVLTGGLSTPLHASTPLKQKEKSQAKVNRHQPRKGMFFEACNKSQEDLIANIDSTLKDYIFVRETCMNLIKTLDTSDVKKTILDNLLKLISIQQDCLGNLVQLMKKDQSAQMEVPEHDKTEINAETIKIEGLITLSSKNYHAAISQRDPSKIVSHLVRKCFPREWWNCYLVSKDKSEQLNCVIGDDGLDGQERLDDGDKKIMSLIVHAYRQVNKKFFTYREQQEARREISQALSDLRRSLKPCSEQQIQSKDESKEEKNINIQVQHEFEDHNLDSLDHDVRDFPKLWMDFNPIKDHDEQENSSDSFINKKYDEDTDNHESFDEDGNMDEDGHDK